MKTKIRLAGGKYSDKSKKSGSRKEEEPGVIYSCDLPLLQIPGLRIVDERGDYPAVYLVTQSSIHFAGGDMWQTAYVIPVKNEG